jgi:hypothetical protein
VMIRSHVLSTLERMVYSIFLDGNASNHREEREEVLSYGKPGET